MISSVGTQWPGRPLSSKYLISRPCKTWTKVWYALLDLHINN